MQNRVTTVDLERPIDLEYVATCLSAQYNPKRFAAITLRTHIPHVTALLFGSGKIVCTGAKCVNGAVVAAHHFVDRLRALGYNARIMKVRTQNIVANAAFINNLDLDKLKRLTGCASSFESDLFPGLVYRPAHTRVVFLVFKTGEVVITGAHNEEEVSSCFVQLGVMLEALGIEVPKPPALPEAAGAGEPGGRKKGSQLGSH